MDERPGEPTVWPSPFTPDAPFVGDIVTPVYRLGEVMVPSRAPR
jgi:hypothetical protein